MLLVGAGDNAERLRSEVCMTRIPREVAKMLAERPLFSGLSQKELRLVAGLGTTVSAEPGEMLTSEGTRGLQAFLVVAGSARCLVQGLEVATLGPGGFFGEMSLLDGLPRSATVIADDPMQVTVFDRREFVRLVETSPKIAMKLLTAMADRIRTLDEQIADRGATPRGAV